MFNVAYSCARRWRLPNHAEGGFVTTCTAGALSTFGFGGTTVGAKVKVNNRVGADNQVEESHQLKASNQVLPIVGRILLRLLILLQVRRACGCEVSSSLVSDFRILLRPIGLVGNAPGRGSSHLHHADSERQTNITRDVGISDHARFSSSPGESRCGQSRQLHAGLITKRIQ
jgi:hypothetical protein